MFLELGTCYFVRGRGRFVLIKTGKSVEYMSDMYEGLL